MRRDRSSWSIYHRGPVEAVVRALETAALGMAGRSLSKHGHQPVRAIGHLMLRLSDARTRAALGLVKGAETTEDREEAMRWVIDITRWAADPRTPEPTEALDEFHAAAFHLDSRLNAAGLAGDGWERNLGRGD